MGTAALGCPASAQLASRPLCAPVSPVVKALFFKEETNMSSLREDSSRKMTGFSPCFRAHPVFRSRHLIEIIRIQEEPCPKGKIRTKLFAKISSIS